MSFGHPFKKLFAVALAIGLPLAFAPACGGSDDASSSKGGTGAVGGVGGGGTGGSGGCTAGVCVLNNCNSDCECFGCSSGRTICKLSENRCVACDPATGVGCTPPAVCSSYGTCAPPGQICPLDAQSNPTITCTTNADCQACPPQMQICDPAKKKCVACTDTNTSQCSPSDLCIDNKCTHKCPDQCTTDNDCARCEYTDGANIGKKAKACFNHKCAECSDTYACPTGLLCQKGQCVKPCGLPGQTAGTCNTDADCGGCNTSTTTPAWKCKFPINGGLHGNCAPQAAGCSDLGQGAVLPSPFDKVTQLCSKDTDCAGVGIQYNVGELIRDLIGGPEVDIGIKKIKIQDANVNYGMNVCASLKLTDTVSCGICVPCKVDSDCKKISLDQLILDLFKGDPLAQIAGSFLIDLLYGDVDDHSLHFQCLNIAAGYGICAPCANPTKPCGESGGTSTGTCDHDVCKTGNALGANCSTCAASVCKNDSYCCTTAWDDICVQAVGKYCSGGCGGSSTCTHSPCSTGGALSSLCSTCTSAVCAKDPYCCNTQSGSWDSTCVNEAKAETACSSECAGGCAHSPCSTGGPLTASCSSCAGSVCAQDPYCCSTDWDSKCVTEAKAVTGCGC